MKAERSPFPRGWPGFALEGLGFDALRGMQGTYGLYDFDDLPSLPETLGGDFRWLAAWHDAPEWAIRNDDDAQTEAALARLRASDPALPGAFTTFLGSPALQGKVRSYTACFIDLSPAPAPIDQGRLVRFLSDQQGCVFWYLFLTPDGDHAVVASPGFYGAPEEEWGAPPPDPGAIVFCAQTFEMFLYRFWLENEIAFAFCAENDEPVPVPSAAQAYLEAYRRRAREGAARGRGA